MCNSCGYTVCNCQQLKPVQNCYEQSYNCEPCNPCSDATICKQKIPAKCTIYNGPLLTCLNLQAGATIEEVIIRLNNLVVYLDNRLIDCCAVGGSKKPLLPETSQLPQAIPSPAATGPCNEFSYNWYSNGTNAPCNPCLKEEECKKEIPASCVVYKGSILENISQYNNVDIELLLAQYSSILCGLKETLDSCCPPPTTTTTTSTSTTTTTSTTTAAPTTTTSTSTTSTSTSTTSTSTTTASPTTTTTIQPTTTSTSSTTTIPITTTTTILVDDYLANKYSCINGSCGTLVEPNVKVALPQGTIPQYGSFYRPSAGTNEQGQFAYELIQGSSNGPGLILEPTALSCSTACNVI